MEVTIDLQLVAAVLAASYALGLTCVLIFNAVAVAINPSRWKEIKRNFLRSIVDPRFWLGVSLWPYFFLVEFPEVLRELKPRAYERR